MSTLYTYKQRIDLLAQAVKVLDFCISRVSAAISYKNNHLINTQISIVRGETYINNGYLKSLGTLLGTHLVGIYTLLATNIDTWKSSVNKFMMFNPRSWTSTRISSSVLLTVNFENFTPIFDVFSVDDVIELSKAQDEKNNGFYTVTAATSTQMIFTPSVKGKNTENDKDLTVTLIER